MAAVSDPSLTNDRLPDFVGEQPREPPPPPRVARLLTYKVVEQREGGCGGTRVVTVS